MTPEQVVELLERTGAIVAGHFVLSSGLHSDRFIQKFRIFENPPAAEILCGALAGRIEADKPQAVVSAAVGGIIPGYIVARALGVRDLFVEKEDGVPVLRRGFVLRPAERVVVVEDVITTGKSVTEVIRLVNSHNAQVIRVAAIVKRGPVDLPAPLTALLDWPLESWPSQACPLCQKGIALADPGSRRLS